jgi:hypothetical protein
MVVVARVVIEAVSRAEVVITRFAEITRCLIAINVAGISTVPGIVVSIVIMPIIVSIVAVFLRTFLGSMSVVMPSAMVTLISVSVVFAMVRVCPMLVPAEAKVVGARPSTRGDYEADRKTPDHGSGKLFRSNLRISDHENLLLYGF